MAESSWGIFVDDDGTVWGTPADSLLTESSARVRRLGGPLPHARMTGDPIRLSFSQIAARYRYATVSSLVPEFTTLESLRNASIKWMPATVALALHHAALCLPQRHRARILSLRQSLRGMEASLIGSEDDVVEVLATLSVSYDSDTSLEQQISDLIISTCHAANSDNPHVQGMRMCVVAAADDPSVPHVARKVVSTLTQLGESQVEISVKSHAAAAAGAAVKMAMLMGMVSEPFLLETTCFRLGVSYGNHRETYIENSTIPTSETGTVELGENDSLIIELTSPIGMQNLRKIPLPIKFVNDEGLAAGVRKFELTFDVDANRNVIVSCKGPSIRQQWQLTDLIRDAGAGSLTSAGSEGTSNYRAPQVQDAEAEITQTLGDSSTRQESAQGAGQPSQTQVAQQPPRVQGAAQQPPEQDTGHLPHVRNAVRQPPAQDAVQQSSAQDTAQLPRIQSTEQQRTQADVRAATSHSVPAEQPIGLMRLIEALDEVDYGVRALSPEELSSAPGQSILTLQGRLLDAIQELGATYYPALHEHFDPTIHEAMGVVARDDLATDTIAEELRRGYTYDGRVIRYSLVLVANPS